jgi:LacI family transcriptional regulator
MPARMKDVAERAGVSTQTVSRVLRGQRWVAPQTAARVRQASQELGYHGNEVAGALKRGRTRTLGLLFPLLTMSIWSDVAEGAEELAHERGYSLLLCDTGHYIEKEAISLSLLLSQRVAGIVYVEPRCRPLTHPACAALVSSNLPVVIIGAQTDDLPYTHLRTDDERAGYVAVRHLLDLGVRSIQVVANGQPYAASEQCLTLATHVQDRIDGALRALQESMLGSFVAPALTVPNTLDGGYRAGESLLNSGLPDGCGVFATTDVIALGMLEAFRVRGVRVPEDVALVAHDGLFASSVSVPAITTIVPPMADMGRTSVELLLSVMDGDAPPQLTVLDAQFVVRESTVGYGPRVRRGLRTSLSDPKAWNRWRSQHLGAPVAGTGDNARADPAEGGQGAWRAPLDGHGDHGGARRQPADGPEGTPGVCPRRGSGVFW